jgi:Icc-related predicted phosphoesterase
MNKMYDILLIQEVFIMNKEVKFWHLTDLHLDCGKLKLNKFPECDYVIVTGDLAAKLGGWPFINILLSKGYIVLFILGNHEYHSESRKEVVTMNEIEKKWKKKSDEFDNFHVLMNDTIYFDDIRFIGTTLWTDFNNMDEGTIEEFSEMRDSQKIYKSYKGKNYGRRGGVNVSHNDLYDKHIEALNYIEKELEKDFDGLTVLLTHHAPLLESIDTRYKDDYESNGLYASDLGYLFEKHKIAACFHGHIHQSKHYYYNGSLITCNPRGYLRYNEINSEFEEGKIIKLKTT